MTEISNLIDKYSQLLDSVYFHPKILIVLVIIISIFYISLGVITIKNKKNRIKSKELPEFENYVCIHMFYEAIITFLISYTIIKLTNANLQSYILNWMVAPICGILIAYFIDNKVIVPLENGGSSKKTSKDSTNNNQITINVNNQDNQQSDNNSNPISDRYYNNFKKITDADLDSDNINKIFKDAINDLNEHQYQQSNELGKQSAILDAMRETMMTDKKFLIEDMIYKCLDRGYATPQEDKKIRADYKNYRKLHGNGEVQELYEKRYLKIDVHN